MKKKKIVNLETKCDNALETEDVVVDEKEGTFSFTKAFLHLGPNIDFLMDDTTGAKTEFQRQVNPWVH